MTIRLLMSFFFSLILFFFLSSTAHAETKLPAMSAKLASTFDEEKKDQRVEILTAYLMQYDSPMAPYAHDFVKYADMYELDWKLVAAISGVESYFGHRIPPNSNNAWGWGVYGDNVHYFSSWSEGIITISHGLRTKYMDKWGATDVASIGSYYASSPTWAAKVNHFLSDIEEFERFYTRGRLSISI